MNCSLFEEKVAEFKEGKLSQPEQSAAESHLANCSECRRLLEIVGGDLDLLPHEQKDQLAAAILNSTSGAVCAGSEAQLWDFVRGRLERDDSYLVALHLDHCARCKSLAEELRSAQEILPSMACLEPDRAFAQDVLNLTTSRKKHRSCLQARLSGWWDCLVNRPRFSLEAAYIGTLALVFVFCSPFLPFQDLTAGEAAAAAVEASSKQIGIVWAETKGPIAGRLQDIRSAARLENLRLFDNWHSVEEYSVASMAVADRSMQGVRSMCRTNAANLLDVWSRLFPSDSESK